MNRFPDQEWRPGVPREEAFSFWSHLLGAVIGIVGLVVLIVRAEGALAVTGVTVYGVTLVLLFAASSLHHVVHPTNPRHKEALRRVDHVAIYVFIAGSYTPVCLLAVPPAWGIPLLAAVWTLALTGSILKIVRPFAPRWLTVGLYVALGWMAAFVAKPVAAALPTTGLALLVAGGIVYTLGGALYAAKWPDWFPTRIGHHGIWHVFVLIGAGLHYAMIAGYIAVP